MATKVQSESESRYGRTSGTNFTNPVSDITTDDIPDLMTRLRRTFASDITKSKQWRKQQLNNFILMMDECSDTFCAAMKSDLHKSHFEGCFTELTMVRNECEYFLHHLDDLMASQYTESSLANIPAWSYTKQDPLGVTLVMGAWNYPCQLSLIPMVGAIAGGNCCVLKPGSYAVEVSHALAECVAKYLDPQAIVVVEGNRDMTAALLRERFDLIFFTGSGFVGKIVAEAAAKHLTPIVLELGGKSPVIVDKSANLEHAAARIVWGTFLNSGQTCVRPDFLLMHHEIADQLLLLMKECVLKFYGENAQKTEWFGRCINAKAYKRLQGLLEGARDQIVIGGDYDEKENFIAPTIFDFGSDLEAFNEVPMMQDELFGPLLPSVRYQNTEDAVEFIRNLKTGKPLALYAFGTDSTFIEEMTDRTTSGGMCINDVIMQLANDQLPFGGVGNSGMGNYHGPHSFETFTHKKAVLHKSPILDESILFRGLLQMRFPPYDSKLKQRMVQMLGSYTAGEALNVPYRCLKQLKRYFFMIAVAAVMYKMGFRIKRE